MKSLLVFFLFLPFMSLAQHAHHHHHDHDEHIAFQIKIPGDSLLKVWKEKGITEIEIRNQKDLEKFLIPIYEKDPLPVIDFTKNYLEGDYICMQCFILCKHQPECHRNACMKEFKWLLVKLEEEEE